MLESLIEQWQIPLRPSRWQLTKLFAAQINRDHPVAAKVGLVLFLSLVFWIVSFLTRPRRLEKELGLPVVSGSRTLEKDFVAVIERGRQMVSAYYLPRSYPHQAAGTHPSDDANRVRPHLVAPGPALYRQLIRPPVRRLSAQEL